ncbi:MAG: hypothetical protein U0931_21405 [Vulcanimicrobiota bacterium]
MHITSTNTRPVQARPGLAEPTKEFSYNPQDSVSLEAGTTRLQVREDGSTDKLKVMGGLAPNDQGQFVYAGGDSRFHGANAFASAARTLALFEQAYGEPIGWSTGRPQLEIHPDNGQVLNAFYSRDDKGLFFFHSTDPVTGKVVYGADSGEVTSHETGHAILDAIRPGYMSSWSGDAAGFHESFGDVLAILTVMQDDRVLSKMAEQTGGDLRQPNLVAALGEELGITINHTAGKNATGGDFTRNAINDFVWQAPSSLPETAPPDKLSSEPHSWSRLWTGAVYDVLGELVKERLTDSPDVKAALSGARDELTEMYGRLMRQAPKGGFKYKQMAAAFIQSDLDQNGGKRASMLGKVFAHRKILGGESKVADSAALAPGGSRRLEVTLDGPEFGRFSGARVVSNESADSLGLTADRAAAQELKDRLKQLIKNGDILYTEPNSNPATSGLFKSDGHPYAGVVRWVDGQMSIERVLIAT